MIQIYQLAKIEVERIDNSTDDPNETNFDRMVWFTNYQKIKIRRSYLSVSKGKFCGVLFPEHKNAENVLKEQQDNLDEIVKTVNLLPRIYQFRFIVIIFCNFCVGVLPAASNNFNFSEVLFVPT